MQGRHECTIPSDLRWAYALVNTFACPGYVVLMDYYVQGLQSEEMCSRDPHSQITACATRTSPRSSSLWFLGSLAARMSTPWYICLFALSALPVLLTSSWQQYAAILIKAHNDNRSALQQHECQ